MRYRFKPSAILKIMGSGKGQARRSQATKKPSYGLAADHREAARDLRGREGQGSDGWWYKNGELHRMGGPAAEEEDGTLAWYVNGELHRVDGRGVENGNGDKVWWWHGRRHRVDGPAVERPEGDNEWWLNGVRVDEMAARTARIIQNLGEMKLDVPEKVTF